ncbi:MAG: phosphonopyruvate decarboxylase [Spirochaetales bacterium]|nr:phosphonopyruvate decarboxylase [Spirochaetales bacterium]
MVETKVFYDLLIENNIDFFTGVPDSLLKSFCAYITDNAPENNHIIAANEGCAVGLAAGYHIATGKVPLVYMQNSGEGNVVNPLLSLTDPEVYRIPLVLVIGWRGEPGVKDEPQHKKQGRVTCSLLDAMEIPYVIMSTDENELKKQMQACRESIYEQKAPFAFVVRKDTFAAYTLKNNKVVNAPMNREEAIECVMLNADENAVFVSTTGMASRELYELREKHGMKHNRDFLTVGSMGQASQIAAAIAMNQPNRTVYCIDGDGAAIMQMGGLTTVGTCAPANFRHILINNGAHDSVGGQPTVGLEIDLPKIAEAVGYKNVYSVSTKDELVKTLNEMKNLTGTTMLEIKTCKGARKDLGRPKTTPLENKTALMEFMGVKGI